MKVMKPGRDEDLHRKLDNLLSQRENQKELEKKIDCLREEFVTSREELKFLREEVKKVAGEIKNSEEIQHLKDSVETCVGYQELFVKDFEKIHGKIQEIGGTTSVKFDNLEQKLQEDARETGNIGNGIKKIERKLENFELNLEEITANGQQIAVFGEKIEKLEQELKGQIDSFSKTVIEMKKNVETEVKTIILESKERKTEKDGKLIEINKTLQNISELEKKIDGFREEFVTSHEEVKFLREEVKKVAMQITNSEEMKHLKDSVETCVGYQKLFVKDFEKIREKTQKIKEEYSERFNNLEQKLQGGARETENIGNGMKNIEVKIDNFARFFEEITEYGQKLDIFGDKIENFEQELKGKIDLMSKSLIEINDNNSEMEVKSLAEESNKSKNELYEELPEIDEKEQNIPESDLKCWNNRCNSILPKNLPLREDGVSIGCPKCCTFNIIGKLKKGHKWMYMTCGDYHYQQFSIDKKDGYKGRCRICGDEGLLRDANRNVALTQNAENEVEIKLKRRQSYFKKLKLMNPNLF